MQRSRFAIDSIIGKPPFTYSWDWGDGSFDSVAYPSHTYDSAGYYLICLTVTDGTGCTSYYYCDSSYVNKTDASMITISVVNHLPVTGIVENIINNKVNIYPNPFTTQTMLTLNPQTLKHTSNQILFLYDLVGRMVKQYNICSSPFIIYRDGLAPGMYFFQMKDGEKIIGTKKVIIE